MLSRNLATCKFVGALADLLASPVCLWVITLSWIVTVLVVRLPSPKVEFMNANLRKISRFLPSAIHKRVFSTLLWIFEVQGLDPGFLL